MKKKKYKKKWRIVWHYMKVTFWGIAIGWGLAGLTWEPVIGWPAIALGGLIICVAVYFLTKEISKWTTKWSVSST